MVYRPSKGRSPEDGYVDIGIQDECQKKDDFSVSSLFGNFPEKRARGPVAIKAITGKAKR
jgi:hypothetical protein